MEQRISDKFLKWWVVFSKILLFGIMFVFLVNDANATSQWSRKYKTSCTTCHSAFPRLNSYGERFMQNGYQDPSSDEPDGNTIGKKRINDLLAIDNLMYHYGVRLNLTPFQMQTNKLKVNGEDESTYAFGKPNWFQIFMAGSVSKNVSIFIEAAFEQDHFHYSWYHIGFHNLAGNSLMNAFIGNISPLDFASYANRLRQIGAIKGDIFGIKSSGGSDAASPPEDALNVSGSRPGIMYYGYKGPVVVWAGISPGSSATDVNNKLHQWVGLKLQVPEAMESAFEGSSVTAWVYKGEDATNTSTVQITNPYTRMSFQGNLRYAKFDVQAAYVSVTEDNYYLSATALEEKYSGISVVAGKNIGRWFPCVMYDKISYDNDDLAATKDRTKATGSISYFLHQNVRLGAHFRIDLSDEDGGYVRSDDGQLNIRIMF